MATNIRVIHAGDFIKATPEGQLDLEKSTNLLVEIASASTSLVEYEIIIDIRKAQTTMSATDLWYLAVELDNYRRVKNFYQKTAVLCPLEEFDQAAFFALCAQNRGINVKAFTSFEDAVEWLVANDT